MFVSFVSYPVWRTMSHTLTKLAKFNDLTKLLFMFYNIFYIIINLYVNLPD